MENPEKKRTYPKEIYTPKKNWLPRNLEDLFTIQEQVGKGTYGDVFKAMKKKVSSSDKKFHALKEIKIINEKEEGFPVTAIREIMILNKLKHENIIHLKEIVMAKDSKRDKVFLSFDYMDYDLSGMLKSKVSLDLSQVKCILYQIVNGLNYLHTNGIMHRDIKSANILMNIQGDIRIGDFGLAKNFTPGTKQPIRSEIVTLWYRAPELLLGCKEYDERIDVWSVGCIFSELLCGEILFKGNDEIDQLNRIFQILGTPTESSWKEATTTKKFSLIHSIHLNRFKEYFTSKAKYNDDDTLNLLAKMLEMDPNKRPTTAEILASPYFTKNHPPMCGKDGLPKDIKECHEFKSYQKEMENLQFERQNKHLKEATRDEREKDRENKGGDWDRDFLKRKREAPEQPMFSK